MRKKNFLCTKRCRILNICICTGNRCECCTYDVNVCAVFTSRRVETLYFNSRFEFKCNAIPNFLLFSYFVCFWLKSFYMKSSFIASFCLLTFWFKYFCITIFNSCLLASAMKNTFNWVSIWLCVGFSRWIWNEVSLVFVFVFLALFLFV